MVSVGFYCQMRGISLGTESPFMRVLLAPVVVAEACIQAYVLAAMLKNEWAPFLTDPDMLFAWISLLSHNSLKEMVSWWTYQLLNLSCSLCSCRPWYCCYLGKLSNEPWTSSANDSWCCLTYIHDLPALPTAQWYREICTSSIIHLSLLTFLFLLDRAKIKWNGSCMIISFIVKLHLVVVAYWFLG